MPTFLSIFEKSTSACICFRNWTICAHSMSANDYYVVHALEKLDLISTCKVGATYRLRMPSSSAQLVPSQVSASRCCTHYHPRRLLDFLVGHCFIACYGVVPGMKAKGRDANGKNGVGRRGVTVVCLDSRSVGSAKARWRERDIAGFSQGQYGRTVSVG